MNRDESVFYLKIGCKEWNYAWEKLSEHIMNSDIEHPTKADNEGEAWQYIDTAFYDNELQHCFRHRCHPKTNCRENVYIQVSDKTMTNFSYKMG